MREYTIVKNTGNWESVPILPIDNLLWTDCVDISAQAQICYDGEALYVRLSAREAHIRAEENGPCGNPCEDSCLEFFFCPQEGDMRYLNIEFNPNCCMYLGLASAGSNLVRILPEDEKNVLSPKAERTNDGWEITYTVPYSFVRRFFPEFAPVSGCTIRANCYKCGDFTVKPHYLAWSPIASEEPAFHRPQDFGLMRFA